MSGALCVPLTIVGCFLSTGITQKILVATGLVCGIYAAFEVWAKERDEKINAEQKLLHFYANIPELELVFNPDDTRFVRDGPTLYNDVSTRTWCIGIRNRSEFKSADDISVKAQANNFVRNSIAVAYHRHVSLQGEPTIFQSRTLAPQAIEFFEVFGVSSNISLTTDQISAPLRSRARFVLEARARDTKTIRATFEYEPSIPPTIKRVED